MYINKAFVFGNLTRDPELRSLPSGVQVSSFSVATNRVWKDRDGNKKEQADFHNVVAFGKTADLVSRYLKKGSSVFVEGRMQTRSWEANDGSGKKYRTEIIADSVQFGPRGSGGGGGGDYQGGAAAPAGGKGKQDDAIDYPAEEINPDDIPF